MEVGSIPTSKLDVEGLHVGVQTGILHGQDDGVLVAFVVVGMPPARRRHEVWVLLDFEVDLTGDAFVVRRHFGGQRGEGTGVLCGRILEIPGSAAAAGFLLIDEGDIALEHHVIRDDRRQFYSGL